jgi:hypothetical protein
VKGNGEPVGTAKIKIATRRPAGNGRVEGGPGRNREPARRWPGVIPGISHRARREPVRPEAVASQAPDAPNPRP